MFSHLIFVMSLFPQLKDRSQCSAASLKRAETLWTRKRQFPELIPWSAQKFLLWFACPDRSHLRRITLVAFSTRYDNTREIARRQNRNTHNRAYSIQHSHLAEMSSLPFFRQGRTACSAQSTSSLADAGRPQPPRGRRLVLFKERPERA